jgi:hypothetical protein
MFQVRDASRILQFEGVQLGHASSERRGAHRWVEFTLYRTQAGSYVLSRVGQTLLYHDPHCMVVARNGLASIPTEALTDGHVPCPECRPRPAELDEVCPEAARNWAMVSETPEGVLEALYRFDDTGVRYLTTVAQKLLEEASEVDPKIGAIYQTETIA